MLLMMLVVSSSVGPLQVAPSAPAVDGFKVVDIALSRRPSDWVRTVFL